MQTFQNAAKFLCEIIKISGAEYFLIAFRQQRSKVFAHSKYALKCHFSPDNKCFATTGADGYVHIWDVADTSKPAKSLYVASDLTKATYPDKACCFCM